MSMERIATALDRVSAALRRKPQAGIHDDAAATARWAGGLRTRVLHDAGHELLTDMPAEIGGEDGAPTPGWFMRAGLASCAVTRIAMAAAAEGIRLETLEARASSRSDTRGRRQRGAGAAAGDRPACAHRCARRACRTAAHPG
eukprot:gene1684-2222_t